MASFADQMAEKAALRATMNSEAGRPSYRETVNRVWELRILAPTEFTEESFSDDVAAKFRQYVISAAVGSPLYVEYRKQMRLAFSA